MRDVYDTRAGNCRPSKGRRGDCRVAHGSSITVVTSGTVAYDRLFIRPLFDRRDADGGCGASQR
jgi:hypothetical protein